MSARKDIKQITIQFLSETGKQNIEIQLASLITRTEALEMQSMIEASKDVFRCWLWTTDGCSL